MKRVHYEWDHEWIDEHGDIVDHDFSHGDDFPGFPNDPNCRLVLVREYYDADGCFLEDKQWAYVADGKLPKEFDGGNKVPQKYHRIINKARAEQTQKANAKSDNEDARIIGWLAKHPGDAKDFAEFESEL